MNNLQRKYYRQEIINKITLLRAEMRQLKEDFDKECFNFSRDLTDELRKKYPRNVKVERYNTNRTCRLSIMFDNTIIVEVVKLKKGITFNSGGSVIRYHESNDVDALLTISGLWLEVANYLDGKDNVFRGLVEFYNKLDFIKDSISEKDRLAKQLIREENITLLGGLFNVLPLTIETYGYITFKFHRGDNEIVHHAGNKFTFTPLFNDDNRELKMAYTFRGTERFANISKDVAIQQLASLQLNKFVNLETLIKKSKLNNLIEKI